jgi:two-component system OmpR family response regulator
MKGDKKLKVFLVDDDQVFLKSLEIDFLENSDFFVETFKTGEQCLAALNNGPDLIVLDYYLDGIEKNAMNGISTLDVIKLKYPDLPVIMLSSQDEIQIAVSCMHHKASDYIVKSPTSFIRLQKIIPIICRYKNMEKELSWYMDRM